MPSVIIKVPAYGCRLNKTRPKTGSYPYFAFTLASFQPSFQTAYAVIRVDIGKRISRMALPCSGQPCAHPQRKPDEA